VNATELTAWSTRAAEAFRVADGIGTVTDRDASIVEYTVRCLADAGISGTGTVLEHIHLARGGGDTDPIIADPASGKPVRGGPRFDERTEHEDWYDESISVEPEVARWDLGFGACLSYGPGEDGGPLTVTLNLSDFTLATGHLRRTVTREQLVDHARHLLRLAGAELTITLEEVAT